MTTKKPAPQVSEGSVSEVALSLQEFCIRLSATDKRVEMIGAFEHAERTAGRLKDAPSAYAGRYQAFLKKPA